MNSTVYAAIQFPPMLACPLDETDASIAIEAESAADLLVGHTRWICESLAGGRGIVPVFGLALQSAETTQIGEQGARRQLLQQRAVDPWRPSARA